MNRKLLGAAFAAALTLLAAGGAAAQHAGHHGGEHAAPAGARLAPVSWTPASSPDSIARWAVEGCRRAGAQKQACYEHALVTTIRPAGVDRVMAALDRLAAADPEVQRQGHVYAHGIGIAAYAGANSVGSTFAKCTPAYQSGCYHGVIQAFFAEAGTGGATAERLNALCADYRTPEGRWIQFQCAHGAGHGLMAVHGQHLLRALDACDLLTDARERDACWGGAFMENVVNATQPHHTSTTQLAAGGGHDHGGGHQHGAAGHGAAPEPFKALDASEPLYPCTVVAERHQASCYGMQTSAILFRNRGNFTDAARQCARAPERMQRVCFISLGRDAASYSMANDAKAVELCRGGSEAHLPLCVIGVAKNRVDVTAKTDDGLAFCRAVPTADAKLTCYRAVGEQAAALHPVPADRERACGAAETPYVAECRTGAGLPVQQGT